jgi:hypothetical protein
MQKEFILNYLWKNRRNRIWWITGLIVFAVQFVFFKWRYPYANYLPDSYSYLEAAANNVDVNMWPVAYSKFLRLVSVFTHSDKIVIGVQYLSLQISSLVFTFSLLYFLKPGKKVKVILLTFLILSPLPLFIANYISADALFISLSLFWLTTLVWLIYDPRLWMILVHAFLILACFTLRYNAIYYPVISLLVFIVSRKTWKFKIAGLTLSALLLLSSYLFTSSKMKEVTGKWQFSAFGGWQLANNALYMYEHIPASKRGPIPVRFLKLETMVREHMDTLRKVKLTSEDSLSNFFYLWNSKGPLIQYLLRDYKKDSITPYFNRWASEGPLYAEYALYLIKRFPRQYAENWLFPNAVKYAVPPTEFLGTYNMGSDSVAKLAKDWFNYKSRKVVKEHNKKGSIAAVEWYPIFSAVVNIIFVLGLIAMILLNAVHWKEYGLPQLLALTLLFWLLNCSFSIFASPIVLRYQFFPLLVFFVMGTIFMERIIKMAMEKPVSTSPQLFEHEKLPSVNQQNLPPIS